MAQTLHYLVHDKTAPGEDGYAIRERVVLVQATDPDRVAEVLGRFPPPPGFRRTTYEFEPDETAGVTKLVLTDHEMMTSS